MLERLMRDDMLRFNMQRPVDSLKGVAGQAIPDVAEAEVEAVAEHIKSELAADPVALLQDPFSGEAQAVS